jgi:hypothetical protein
VVGQKGGQCRKVVEHVVLYKMKDDLTDEQEKDMLDHLFSLQYRFRGILAVSLGAYFCVHIPL